ncbi:hypothetical protein TTHERM_000066749 (macronuclear) [Tetrahymena thermophila SB210]|uniref:Uncharacterized protein n=1 Tax=Tetrahymena thermophila (strain SB210) TaxID=312017 RepID=W7XH46_TETTS|nr:hypothetical protein TTHERM_000066749 [Tetrahymena thermophila SB210]EWS76468.1 hypothetical protein TTHERM_000066749 [Tetrahymena thermophila SB210]|eukprot:XP_012650997.1 hypothetical protein TTHERM_000066749 [Tetrahymena thermophila SB210]
MKQKHQLQLLKFGMNKVKNQIYHKNKCSLIALNMLINNHFLQDLNKVTMICKMQSITQKLAFLNKQNLKMIFQNVYKCLKNVQIQKQIQYKKQELIMWIYKNHSKQA